jgi:prephenate dehydratase
MRVAYQGEPGAYGEEAVLRMFGDCETVQCGSFAAVFEAVARGDADRGVVPVENSMAGCINETYDLLLKHTLVITGELELRVSHCLMALPGQTLDQIRTVYSHPQGLAQCSAFLARLGAELMPFYNTAGSAKMIREKGLAECAAVASRRAARLYELEVLADQIEDARASADRAVMLARTRGERGYEAYALRLAGEIASRCGSPNLEQAQGHYWQAMALAEELGMRPLVGHCHLGLGKHHRRAGDLVRTREHLTTAATMYREMDMGFWLEKAEAELPQSL